jgi:hypothetical protein
MIVKTSLDLIDEIIWINAKENGRMDNPETTLCTRDTGRRQTKQKTQHGKLKRRATRTKNW